MDGKSWLVALPLSGCNGHSGDDYWLALGIALIVELMRGRLAIELSRLAVQIEGYGSG